MKRSLLWKKWIGLNGLKRSSAVFCLPVLLACSLFLSFLFSQPVNADSYVGQLHDLGSPSSSDLNEYMLRAGRLNYCLKYFYNNSSTCLTQYTDFGDTQASTGPIYKPNAWNFGNYDMSNIKMYVPENPSMNYYYVPLTTSSSGTQVYYDAIKMSCSNHKYYYGDSFSFTNVYTENGSVIYNSDGNSYSPFYESSSEISANGTQFRLFNNLYKSSVSVVYQNVSENNTVTAVYEVTPYLDTGSIYFSSLGVSEWVFDKFYALDSNGTDSTTSTWAYNGFVAGCSESAVKSTLASIDSNPVPDPDPIPDNFPSSWDSQNNQNNEEAWEILENINPVDFQVNTGSSNDIIQLILSFFRTFAEVDTNRSYCGIYMPAFFGNKFSFGNNGGDNDFLYVNLCQNAFVDSLFNDGNYISIISQQSQYGGNSWLYVGVKGLIYFFCFWLLIKILLGYVYWIYSLIDTTFGLVNDIKDS